MPAHLHTSGSSDTPRHPDLSVADLTAAEQVGRRLASELRAILDALGWPTHSARSVSRMLGVDPNLCQRAALAARCIETPLEALRRTPGIEGLHQLRRAFSRRKVDVALVEALNAAAAQLEDLIDGHGGSLDRLRAALDEAGARRDEPVGADRTRERRAAFNAMAASVGCRLDTLAVSVFMRPGAGGQLEGFVINTHVGWHASPGGLPLLLSLFGDADAQSDRTGAGSTAPAAVRGRVLERYSTQPTPLVTLHRATSGVSMQMLDPAWQPARRGSPRAGGVDVAVLNPLMGVSDPRRTKDPLHTSFVRCRYPTRELILDVFLAEELARSSTAAAGVYWSGKWLTDGLPAPWHDRLPGPAPLLIRRGLPDENPSQHCPWYTQMVREVAASAGWSERDLVSHRLVVRFPIWGSAHIISFDFSRSTGGAGPVGAGLES